MRYLLLLLSLVLLFFACNEEDWTTNYKTKKVKIKEIKKSHTGNGVFNEVAYFDYFIDNQTYHGEYDPQGYENSYTSSFNRVHSLTIKYRPNDPSEYKVYLIHRSKVELD